MFFWKYWYGVLKENCFQMRHYKRVCPFAGTDQFVRIVKIKRFMSNKSFMVALEQASNFEQSSCLKLTASYGHVHPALFLDAFSHLYKRVCPSVTHSFCLSVRNQFSKTQEIRVVSIVNDCQVIKYVDSSSCISLRGSVRPSVCPSVLLLYQ